MREAASSLVRSRTLFLARDEVDDLEEERALDDDSERGVGGKNAAEDAVATAAIRATSLYFAIVLRLLPIDIYALYVSVGK